MKSKNGIGVRAGLWSAISFTQTPYEINQGRAILTQHVEGLAHTPEEPEVFRGNVGSPCVCRLNVLYAAFKVHAVDITVSEVIDNLE
jgi:hypothetical protein